MYPLPMQVSLDALQELKDDAFHGSFPVDAASRHALWEIVGVVLGKIDPDGFQNADDLQKVVMVEQALGDRGLIGNGKLLKLVPYIIEIVKLFK